MSLPNERGFTLVELLVTILITAILMTMIGGILVSVLNSKKKVEHRDQAAAVAQAVLQLVSEDLRSFMVPAGTSSTFRGEELSEGDRMGFVVFRRPFVPPVDEEEVADPDANLFEVGYFVEETPGEEGEQGMLTLFRREVLGFDGDALEGGEGMEIASRLRLFQIEYLGFDQEYTPEEWERSWEEEEPPRLVRITVEVVGYLPPGVNVFSEEAEGSVRRFQTLISLPYEPEPRERGGGGSGGG